MSSYIGVATCKHPKGQKSASENKKFKTPLARIPSPQIYFHILLFILVTIIILFKIHGFKLATIQSIYSLTLTYTPGLPLSHFSPWLVNPTKSQPGRLCNM
jgi:hypothetical protein